MADITLADFENEGLYIIFPDHTRLELTKENIEKNSELFWNDPGRIAPEIKKAVDFRKCHFCPRKNQEDICDAIRPVLPFLDKIDRYLSFDEVTAVYKGSRNGVLHIRKTSMQAALQYVAMLSLLRYNMVLRKYWKYYYGVIPLMDSEEAACRIYLNMYWQCKGDKAKIDALIAAFKEELRISSANQVSRLGLVCKNDAFINSFLKIQTVCDFLEMDIEGAISKGVERFENSYTHHF